MNMNSGAGGGTVVLASGTYIMDAGDFRIGGQVDITGEGVTIILTANPPTDTGTVDINGGASVTLSAQTLNDLQGQGTELLKYAGVLIYLDPGALESLKNKINGGSNLDIEGALVFPSSEIDFNGTTVVGEDGYCIKIIGRKTVLSETSDFTILDSADHGICAIFKDDLVSPPVYSVRLME